MTVSMDDVLIAKHVLTEQDELRAATGQTAGVVSYDAVKGAAAAQVATFTPVAYSSQGRVD